MATRRNGVVIQRLPLNDSRGSKRGNVAIRMFPHRSPTKLDTETGPAWAKAGLPRYETETRIGAGGGYDLAPEVVGAGVGDAPRSSRILSYHDKTAPYAGPGHGPQDGGGLTLALAAFWAAGPLLAIIAWGTLRGSSRTETQPSRLEQEIVGNH